MKPIRELANDREACERIAREIFDETFRDATVGYRKGVNLICDSCCIYISGNGTVGYSYDFNPFKFVKLLTELGYEPEE